MRYLINYLFHYPIDWVIPISIHDNTLITTLTKG